MTAAAPAPAGWPGVAARAADGPVLVGVSHGTADPAGQATVARLLERIRAARPGLVASGAFVEVQRPLLRDALATTHSSAVVVPLLLSTGYHVAHDVRRAVRRTAGAVAAPPLGPHPLLVAALADRLAATGVPPGVPTVLAAAGSSDPAAARDVESTAALLAARTGRRVVAAYASAARPTVAEAVAGLRRDGHPRVAVATYLLAPGHFARVVARAGGDWTSAPLGDHDAVVDLVLQRYDAAARTVCRVG